MFDTLGQRIGADRFDAGEINLAVLVRRKVIGEVDRIQGIGDRGGERLWDLVGGAVGVGIIEEVAGIDEGGDNFTDADGAGWGGDFPVDADGIAAGNEGGDINNLVADKAFLNGGRKGVAGGIAGIVGSSGGGVGIKGGASEVVVVLAVEFGIETG